MKVCGTASKPTATGAKVSGLQTSDRAVAPITPTIAPPLLNLHAQPRRCERAACAAWRSRRLPSNAHPPLTHGKSALHFIGRVPDRALVGAGREALVDGYVHVAARFIFRCWRNRLALVHRCRKIAKRLGANPPGFRRSGLIAYFTSRTCDYTSG